MPEGAIYVGLPSVWGNNFDRADFETATACVEMFRHDLAKFECFHPERFERFIAPLRGKNLCCWCDPSDPCHADVLLELANA